MNVSLRRLDLDDVPALQELLERCSDYFLMQDGVPAWPDAAREEFTPPPGHGIEDVFVYAVEEDARMIGVASVARDFPKPGAWWIGFLIFDPAYRSRGLGRYVFDELVQRMNAETIWIGVLEKNERAQRFWRSLGFEEKERQMWTSAHGTSNNVILMRR